MEGGGRERKEIVRKIQDSFSRMGWPKAESRVDMNTIWVKWVRIYNSLVEELIGTRWARVSSWGRKFNSRVRELCTEASIARSWFIEAKRSGRDMSELFENWKRRRQAFQLAWEQSNTDWYVQCVKRAISDGDVAVWRLLSDKWKKTSRSLAVGNGIILTDPIQIERELRSFHDHSRRENSSVTPGEFQEVKWDQPFLGDDMALNYQIIEF